MVGDGETVYTLSDSSDDECANNEPAANCPPRCATLVQNKRQRTEQIERDAAYARALVNDEAADANDAASVALARTLQEAENAKAYSASSSGGGTSTSSNSGKHFTLVKIVKIVKCKDSAHARDAAGKCCAGTAIPAATA